MAPLQFSEPYFRQRGFDNERVEKEPLRFSEHMTEIRSHEMTDYGRRKHLDTRRMKIEFTEKIKEIALKQKREEEEARRNKKDKRSRWWHRTRGGDKREPIKLLRYTNLKIVPESLLMSKDVVILQLTGARLGDAAMNWVGAFVQQSYTLKRLVLQGNYITEEGVEHLTLGIRSSKSLMELDLSFNPIGDVSVELVCNALLENNKFSKLYLLNVSCCELTSNSGFQLGRLMHEFKHLQCLLAWRNQLGIANGASISGAGFMLDELRHSPHMRMLNLTANNITDREASDHAAALERATRRVTVANLEKHQRQRNIEKLRAEVAERKAKMVGRNMEEKMAIHRLERQADQEQQKIDMTKKLEERQRTYAEKQEIEFLVRVKRQTGSEIEVKKPVCRVILTGNSIGTITHRRLARYYSLDSEPDAEGFVSATRRFDNLVIPRRKVGEPHPDTLRDENAFDEHSVLPWDTFSNPEGDFRRRQALLEWKEEERIREEQLVLAEFSKFAVVDTSNMSPEERARLGTGFNLASGVGARVKMVRDPAKAAEQKEQEEKAEAERKARIRQQYGKKADDAAVTTTVRPQYQPRRTQDPETVGMVRTKSGANAAELARPPNEHATTSHQDGEPIAIIIDPSGSTEGAPLAEIGGGGASSFVELNEADLMQLKMNERMAELRIHLDQRHGRGKEDDSTRGVSPAIAPALSPRTESAPLNEVIAAVEVIRATWVEMQQLGEIGSPSDEDLQKLEGVRCTLPSKKQHLATLLALHFPVGGTTMLPDIDPEGDVAKCFEQFLEDLIKETDHPEGNEKLLGALIDHLPLPYSKILADRGLVAIAASDGSEQYFSKLLSIPQHEFDIGEVCAACFYNQTCRIPLTLILLQFLDLSPYLDEVGDILREFVADIASDRRSIPRENRILKMMLLKMLMGMSWLQLDVTAPGTDGQCILSRALYEGDLDVVELLLEDPARVRNIDDILPDGSTLLMQAVMGNSLPTVQKLFSTFPGMDVSVRGENGNALDLAIGLSRDVKIVSLLREHGAQPSGAKVDKDVLAPKKIKMKRSPLPSNNPTPTPASGGSTSPT